MYQYFYFIFFQFQLTQFKNPNGRASKFSKYSYVPLGKKKNYKYLGVGQNLTEFAKISTLEYLNLGF
jgi:hypothetical protein